MNNITIAEAQRNVAKSYVQVVLLQCLLGICFVIALWIFNTSIAAISALIGVGIAVAGSAVYARLALVKNADSANAVLGAHVKAELAKIATVVVLFIVVFVGFKWVAAGWMLAAFLVASAGYWVSLFVVK